MNTWPRCNRNLGEHQAHSILRSLAHLQLFACHILRDVRPALTVVFVVKPPGVVKMSRQCLCHHSFSWESLMAKVVPAYKSCWTNVGAQPQRHFIVHALASVPVFHTTPHHSKSINNTKSFSHGPGVCRSIVETDTHLCWSCGTCCATSAFWGALLQSGGCLENTWKIPAQTRSMGGLRTPAWVLQSNTAKANNTDKPFKCTTTHS